MESRVAWLLLNIQDLEVWKACPAAVTRVYSYRYSSWHLQYCVTIILVIIPAIGTRTAVNGKGILRAARADGWHRAHMGVVAPPGGVQHTKC